MIPRDKNRDPKEFTSLGSYHLQKGSYLVGAALNLLTRKITTTSASAARNMAGIPASSAKPVLGSAVDVGMTVSVVCGAEVCEAEICVNAAPTVAVAGFDVREGVTVD